MLAASNLSFGQKIIETRTQFMRLSRRQLPFGQLPLLQIDGLELVQSQAIIRYLAKRSNLIGKDSIDELKCDVIAETVRDLIALVSAAPFKRYFLYFSISY